MSTLAFIEKTFRYALVLQISEGFFNVSFPGIVFHFVLTYVLVSFTVKCFTNVPFPCVGILRIILRFAFVFFLKKRKKMCFLFFSWFVHCLNVLFSKTNQDSMFANVTRQNKFWKQKCALHIVILHFNILFMCYAHNFKASRLRCVTHAPNFQSTLCFRYVDTCCTYLTKFSLHVQVSSS